jgi:hypothetical protein
MLNLREIEIKTEAENRSEICTSEAKDIYRIAFRDGAQWADSHREWFEEEYDGPLDDDPEFKYEKMMASKSEGFPQKRMHFIQREEDGSLTEEFRRFLTEVPVGTGFVLMDMDQEEMYYISADDPNTEKYLEDNPILTVLMLVEHA